MERQWLLLPQEVCIVLQVVRYKTEKYELGMIERFIHSEIYKAYPKTQSVLHSHSLDVVPFSISSTPLQACFHRGGFLGTAVPVWDIASVYEEYPSYIQDLRVIDTTQGADLAKSLGPAVDGQPTYPVVLMRGHGMVVTSDYLEMTVLRGIYTAQNAKVQMAAAVLGGPVRNLSERECRDREVAKTGVVKPWPLWVLEVEDKSIYKNDLSKKE
jgi:ribulose-5-phosphate 4-epimerase/fuculose-1-phosphate aldolase